MTVFLCWLWPYLAGGLIGWLLAGWLAKRLQHNEAQITERVIEKAVDNPEHLALINKLQKENSEVVDLRSKVSLFESSHVNKATVDDEEVVDKELTAKVEKLKAENAELLNLKNELKTLQSTPPKIVEKLIDKEIDNPLHIQKITDLESEIETLKKGIVIDTDAAKAAGFKLRNDHDLTAIEGIGPKTNDLINNNGIKSFNHLANAKVLDLQKILDEAGSSFVTAKPDTWPDQANLAANNHWNGLKALQDVLVGGVYPDTMASAKSPVSAPQIAAISTKEEKPVANIDVDAAKAAGFKVKSKKGQDDFTVIEGVGPKISELIHEEGIHTYSELGRVFVEDIQKILDKAGPSFKLAKPGTWPAQADMAASNQWESLKAWQEKLDGGEE